MSLADYELLEELGRGGMGAVVLARHRSTGARRAVKLLPGVPSPEALERFRREAQAVARLGAEGVVPVHEAATERGRLYMVMGLMTGGSLRDRLKRDGRLAPGVAIPLVLALARALERCHEAGLVHRDLKPENVLFDEEGRPCLADFGCARDLAATTLTETGTLAGTPAYMAPEQLDGQKVDGRADVYALGLILHELVAGERPFRGTSIVELLLARTKNRRAPLASVVPEVGAELDRVLDRALEPDPARRTASARQLADELEAVAACRALPRPEPRRRKLAAALGAALGVLLSGVGVTLATRPPPSKAPPPAPSPVAGPLQDKAPAPRARSSAEVAADLASARQALERRSLTAAEEAVGRALSAGSSPPPREATSPVLELLGRRLDEDCGKAYAMRDVLHDAITDAVRTIRLARAIDPAFALPPVFGELAVRSFKALERDWKIEDVHIDALVLAAELAPWPGRPFRDMVGMLLPTDADQRLLQRTLAGIDRAIQLQPDEPYLRLARGLAIADRAGRERYGTGRAPSPGLLARTHDDLDRVLAAPGVSRKDAAQAIYLLALVEELQGRFEAAAARFEAEGSPLQGEDFRGFGYQSTRARILLEVGRHRDASRVLKRALASAPEEHRAASRCSPMRWSVPTPRRRAKTSCAATPP